jgi:hypothetical protein
VHFDNKFAFFESTLPDGFNYTSIDIFHEKNISLSIKYLLALYKPETLNLIFAKNDWNVEKHIFYISEM